MRRLDSESLASRWCLAFTLIVLLGACAHAPDSARDSGDSRPTVEPDPDFRHPAPRRPETIFSALDLPAPSRERLASGAPGPDYWQQRTDYVIAAELDEVAKRVTGRAEVTYHNNSPTALPFIWMHLEQNLFHPESIGAQIHTPDALTGADTTFAGGIKLDYVRAGHRPLKCDVYDTLARIDLPIPVAAHGGTFTFEIAWSFAIPPNGDDRMGFEQLKQGTVFEIAQWFPAVATYDAVHGWNTLPYLGQGEFYTDFGSFDVKLTVPHAHLVGATGVLQNPEEVLSSQQRERLATAARSTKTVIITGPDEVGRAASRPPGDGPLTWHFQADQVRSFAWASSSAFIWDASSTESGILCQSLYPAEGLPLWSGATDMLRFSIEHYGETWFRYPYPVATNVNGIVGGMEYPMIIFCSERADEVELYGVTTHEIGHNWFPMMVNSDERRHAWMDEGFNTFINWYSLKARFPKLEMPTRYRGVYERPNRPDLTHFLTQENRVAIDTPADQLEDDQLGALEYDKVAVGLVCLRERIMEPERFDRAFREYIEAWAFKSPQPADFFRSMENSTGLDLSWFWRGWFLEAGYLDQAVTKVEVAPLEEEEPVDAKESAKPREPDPPAVLITFQNLGDLVMPLTYRVIFTDGSDDIRTLPVEVWFHSNQFTARLETGTKTVKAVIIDPDHGFPDVNLANNRWGSE